MHSLLFHGQSNEASLPEVEAIGGKILCSTRPTAAVIRHKVFNLYACNREYNQGINNKSNTTASDQTYCELCLCHCKSFKLPQLLFLFNNYCVDTSKDGKNMIPIFAMQA